MGAQVEIIEEIVFDTCYQGRRNYRQEEFIEAVLKAVFGLSDLRYFFYGGAIRGGKTAVCCAVAAILAEKFAGSRTYVVRESFPVMQTTIIPSAKKFFPSKLVKRWNADRGNYFCEFHNGSLIYFFPESITRDKDLDRFKGIEANFFLLEQIEELQYETFQKCLERVGSWYLDGKTPPPIVLANFNPSTNWIKEKIYEPFKEGLFGKDNRQRDENDELVRDEDGEFIGKDLSQYYYLQALPTDNPYVTDDQWKNWNQMDAIHRKRFVEGDWESSDKTGNWLYSFLRAKHVSRVEYDTNLPLWLSFDFNVNPMTCIAAQHWKSGERVRIVREFRVENTWTGAFVEYVKKQLPEMPRGIYVTGDPAGYARSSMAAKNTTHYSLIQEGLRIKSDRFEVMTSAPTHANSRAFCCSVFDTHKNFLISDTCKYLIQDLEYVKALPDGHIDKSKEHLGHLLDCMRYYLHVAIPNFVKFGS